MPIRMLQQIQQAISNLNPNEVREQVERPVRLNLFTATTSGREEMERFFHGASSAPTAAPAGGQVVALSAGSIDVYEEGMRHPHNAYVFQSAEPGLVVKEILKDHFDHLGLALARRLPAFRNPVAKRIIRNISRENALFSLATAIPDVIPLISLPWAVGEFASDTAFITMNQMRMAFLLSAASGLPVGYKHQKGEIASIVAGAFGWRAIARELVGKIPMGGGLLPKAAIAYAGTYVMGAGIDRYLRLGHGYTNREKREAYQLALKKGKRVAGSIMDGRRVQG